MICETTNLLTQRLIIAYPISLITLWVSFIIIFPSFTYLLKSSRTNWGRFWIVWFLSAIVTGMILIFLIISPQQLINIFAEIKNLLI